MTSPLPPAVVIDEAHDVRVFRIGPYRLAERLGEGAMGVVYSAERDPAGARVAIKTARNTRQSAVASIRREIEILEQLDHPGVVRLLDQGTSQGIPWFAMEPLEGPTLLRALAQTSSPFDSQLELGAPGTMTHLGGARGQFDGPGPLRPRGARVEQRRVFELEQACPIFLILSDLCHTLSYLHNEGLIHRDLKPSNVFLRRSSLDDDPCWQAGKPVLVDFGVVGWFEGSEGRERLMGIDRRRFAGTLQYMAPEQIRGELVDARADLYAVGCILYAGVIGDHPFAARTPQEIIQRHIDGDYIPPGELVEGLPRELVALIDKLLARDLGDRIGHADVVAETLERLVGVDRLGPDRAGPVRAGPVRAGPVRAGPVRAGPDGGTKTHAPSAGGSDVRSIHLSKPGFVGRDDLFAHILGELREIAAGTASPRTNRPTLLAVGGHSGSGKTRFAMEIGAAAENAGFCVTTECAEASLTGPRDRAHAEPLCVFRSTLQAIADHCRERGAQEASHVVGRRANVLAQYEPSLAGLPGHSSQSSGRTVPVELPSRAARVRTFAYLTETLVAFATRRPVLIIIDDLHLADELSLGFLESMLRGGGLEQVVVLATYRLEERAEMDELLDDDHVAHFELDALERDDVASLVGGMLAMDNPPADFVERLASLSVGNPFAVSEYVHAAVEQGLLVRAIDGTWHVDRVLLEVGEPGELLAPSRRLASVIEGRLERLEWDGRRLVDVAAVSMRRLDPELLGELVGLSKEALEAGVERLCRRRIFEAKAGRVRLVEQVRQVAYGHLGKSQGRLLHRRLARALERRACGEGGDEADVLHLLEQWRGAGVRSRELCYVEQAAENALVRGAPSAARALLQRGLRLVNQLADGQRGALDLRRARLERMLAKVHWSRGEVDLTITMLESSLAHLGFAIPKTAPEWCAASAFEVGQQLRNLLWPPGATAEDRADAERLEQGLESGISLLWPMMLRGDLDQAMALATMLANMSDRLGASQHYALPFALISGYCGQLGFEALANLYDARARENLARSRSVTDFIGATRIFAYWAGARGDWEQVDRLLAAAMDFSEDVGDQLGYESLLISGAVFELTRDRLQPARELLRRTEQLGPLGGNEVRGAWSRVVDAMIARQEGDNPRALECIDGQVQRFSRMSERTGLGYALTIAAVTHCEAGLVTRGFHLAKEALAAFETLSGGGDRNVVLYYIYEWLPTAFLCCWYSDALDDAERGRALEYVRALTDRLERFARNVLAARAAWLRNRGVLTAIDGDLAAASALLSKSIAEARRFGLPYQDRLTRQAAASLGELSAR